MAIGVTREDPFIELFLSAYEKGSWADAGLRKPDAIDRTNPAVDKIAERKSDGMTLAIEHTIIEPFVLEKEDYASFSKADFFSIEKDRSVLVPGIWIQVFVPVATLGNQPPAARKAIVQSVHDWLEAKRLNLPEGSSQQPCPINGAPTTTPDEITLTVRMSPLARSETGAVHVRRRRSTTVSVMSSKGRWRRKTREAGQYACGQTHPHAGAPAHLSLLPGSHARRDRTPPRIVP